MPSISWKGTISFGLVSFPVQLFAAARAETIHFHLLHKKDLSRVKQVWHCEEEDRPVERSEMVKGYEAGESGYVVVEDQELKQVAPPTASTMEIVQFVASDEVDPIYFESSYYVAPDGKTPKPYSLFVEALKQSKQSAIAQLAMHNREHVVLIRPFEKGLILHTLYYVNELNVDNRADVQKADFSSKELALAQSLIKHLTAPFEPEQFTDSYRTNVQRLIDEKRKGRKVTPISQPRKAPVIDLMEALQRSLKSARPEKPAGKKAASATTPRKPPGRHRAA